MLREVFVLQLVTLVLLTELNIYDLRSSQLDTLEFDVFGRDTLHKYLRPYLRP